MLIIIKFSQQKKKETLVIKQTPNCTICKTRN